MIYHNHIRSDREFGQPPTPHYTTLCPVVLVVAGEHSQLGDTRVKVIKCDKKDYQVASRIGGS